MTTQRLNPAALSVIGLIALTGSVSADVHSWIDFGGGDAHDATNWSPLGAPQAFDEIRFDIGGTYLVNFDDFFLPSVAIHSYSSGSVTIRTNGTHGATSAFYVGRFSGDNPTVTIDQGEFVSTNQVFIGLDSASTGTMTVTGGFGNYGRFRTSSSTADIRVGSSGDGTLNVFNGGDVDSNDDIFIADNVGSTGVVTVAGFNTSLFRSSTMYANAPGGKIYVGDHGDGELNVINGGEVVSDGDFVVATHAGSTGEVNVHTAFVSSSDIAVGENLLIGHRTDGAASGDATFSIGSGGIVVVDKDTHVGSDFGGSGHLNITGGSLTTRSLYMDHASSSLSHTGGVINILGGEYTQNSTTLSLDGVGASNKPRIRLTGGAEAAIGFSIRIGDDAGMYGGIEVDGNFNGAPSTLRNTGGGAGADLYVGDNGFGTLDVVAGGLAQSNDDIVMGNTEGSTGDTVVSGVNNGARSTLRTMGSTTTSDIFVGNGGDGTLMVADGGFVEADNNFVVAAGVNSVGDVEFEGQSGGFFSELHVGDDLLIGTGSTGSERGIGSVRFGNASIGIVDDHTYVGTNDSLHIDDGEFHTTNLTLFANNSLDLDSGLLVVDGGTFTSQDSNTLHIDGSNEKVTPTLRLDNGADWTNTSHGVDLGGIHDGYMEIFNNSSATIQDIAVGGVGNSAIGQLYVNGDSSLTLGSFLRVQGNTDSRAEFTDGAQIVSSSVFIRDNADMLVADANTHLATGEIQVGDSTPGHMVVNNGASVETTGALLVGTDTGSSGSTLFIQDAGTTFDAFSVQVGGPNSTGSLWVQNGAELNTIDEPLDLIMDVRIWPGSEIEINDGTLRLVDLTLEDNALLHGSGAVTGMINSDPADVNAEIRPDGTLTLGSSQFSDAFDFSGILDVDAHNVTIHDADLANLGAQTIFDGGTLNIPNGAYLQFGETITGEGTLNANLVVGSGSVTASGLTGLKLSGYVQTTPASTVNGSYIRLLDGGILEGSGAIDAPYRADAGSLTTAVGDWVIGDPLAPNGFHNSGVLDVGAHHVTLLDSTNVFLGEVLMSGGTLSIPSGVTFGGNDGFTGHGVIESTIDSSQLLGGGSAPPYITLTGDLEVGDAASANGFEWHWGVGIGSNTFTVHDLDEAEFRGNASLSGGTIIAPNGIEALRSGAIFGNGVVQGDVEISVDNALSPSGDGLRLEGMTTNFDGHDMTGSRLLFGDGVSGGYNGAGTLDMEIFGDVGSTIANTSTSLPLVMGDASSANGFLTRGQIQVVNSTITLHDADYAQLGSLTRVGPDIVGGGDTAPRTLIAPNGVEVGSGEELRGGFGTLDISLDGKVLTQPGSLTQAVGTFSFGDASDVNGVDLGGELDVNTRTVTLWDANEAQLGELTTIDSGQLVAANGVRLHSGDTLTGNGLVDGAVHSNIGSTISHSNPAGGPMLGDHILTLGDASSTSGVSIGGTLHAGMGDVELLDADAAELGDATYLTGGTITAANGIDLFDTDTIYGQGGIIGNINGGTMAPSGVLGVTGDIDLEAGGGMQIDLSGNIPGITYGQLAVTGMIDLDGELDVSLSGGFEPQWGDTFDILTADMITGAFSAETLPALADSDLRWFTDMSSSALSVGVRFFTDLDRDGVIGAGDLATLIGVWGAVGSSLGFDADFDGNGSVGSADLATLIGTWGFSAPPGALVPAPGTAVLLVMGLGLTARRPRRNG